MEGFFAMLFVILGVLLILLNFIGVGPTANWNWDFTGDLWKFCVPFVFAVVWWIWTDKSGYDKRREIEKMDDKKRKRREENLEALGMDPRSRRKRKL
jgi:small Trp-rich protein